jgi:hypothetical protein
MFLAAFCAKYTFPISHIWFLNGKKKKERKKERKKEKGANILELYAACAYLNMLELVQFIFLLFALFYHTFISLM